jgi:hypothetical protein
MKQNEGEMGFHATAIDGSRKLTIECLNAVPRGTLGRDQSIAE